MSMKMDISKTKTINPPKRQENALMLGPPITEKVVLNYHQITKTVEHCFVDPEGLRVSAFWPRLVLHVAACCSYQPTVVEKVFLEAQVV